MTELILSDEQTRADVATFVGRALRVDGNGAIRLQAQGMTLALWVGALSGSGLVLRNVAVAMRAVALGQPADLDVVVPLVAIRDRLAREDNGRSLPVPPQEVVAAWAAMSPPRSGWAAAGEIDPEGLKSAALQGISRIKAGESAETVWAEALTDAVTKGAAFAAYALGFLGDQPAQVRTAGNWTRLSTAAGHVLTR
ncbi:hypothetical protein G9U51_08820 [Calidifontibacter sp. DB0510]|uniref:Uncharacterized protein n=1 Tax=Metallococcus carri TaxID=1656884 RepID=A0A967EEP9_9MICO|nr:hypothetical protein [Metallococcus carri]NHN55876.1 hypothetical protein [Metallococcus carri]NOP38436.1 hypothetical protein [Calidifontibacter sp. DB2511S]